MQSCQGQRYYSLSSGALPSHIRSIRLRQDSILEEEARKIRAACTTRIVYVTLALIFVMTSSVAITIVVHEIRALELAEENNDMLGNQTSYSVLHQRANATSQARLTRRINVISAGEPCVNVCSAYPDAAHDAVCERDVCVCRGQDYKTDTCLRK